jgi:arylsulfatase A-like enzyme
VFEGQHRLPGKKQQAYEEDLRVPLIVRLPGAGGPSKSAASVANIDLAPTILDLAEAQPCRTDRACRVMDGRSLMPLLTGRGGFPKGRELNIEFDLVHGRSQRGSTCAFTGIHTPKLSYVEHSRAVFDATTQLCEPIHEVEHYDLDRDPKQLENRAAPPVGAAERARLDRLAASLDRLSTCSGIRHRDPRAPDTSYCQ